MRKGLWPGIAIAATLLAAVLQLRHQGRAWWCACGQLALWSGDVCSSRNSQDFLDPYSFTHLLHGVAFCGLLALLVPRLELSWRLWPAILLEALWEVIENSEFVIQRYREETAALGYHGDTILNSLGDICVCAAGFIVAGRLGLRRSLVLFAAIEVILIVWIRDSLLLEIIMLVHPVAAIKAWQMCR